MICCLLYLSVCVQVNVHTHVYACMCGNQRLMLSVSFILFPPVLFWRQGLLLNLKLTNCVDMLSLGIVLFPSPLN